LIFGIISLLIIVISIFGYYKVSENENRLVISDVRISGMCESNNYNSFTTKDDLILKWSFKGDNEEIKISATNIESNSTTDIIQCYAKDGFLRIPESFLKDFWGCPTLNDIFTIRINIQTKKEIQTFGPFKVKPALAIQYYLNPQDNSVEVWTQTMNCGLYQYSYLFNIVAWEKHKPNTESLHIKVTDGKGKDNFSKQFDIDPATIKVLYDGEYPDDLVRIFKL